MGCRNKYGRHESETPPEGSLGSHSDRAQSPASDRPGGPAGRLLSAAWRDNTSHLTLEVLELLPEELEAEDEPGRLHEIAVTLRPG